MTFVLSLIQEMTVACEVIFVFYSCVGAIILIIMSCLAGAALRSTRSQVINTTPLQLLQELVSQIISVSLFCFDADRFRQSSWWLRLQPNHRLSKIDGSGSCKILRRGQQTWGKCWHVLESVCHRIVSQLCCKITFYWFLVSTLMCPVVLLDTIALVCLF